MKRISLIQIFLPMKQTCQKEINILNWKKLFTPILKEIFAPLLISFSIYFIFFLDVWYILWRWVSGVINYGWSIGEFNMGKGQSPINCVARSRYAKKYIYYLINYYFCLQFFFSLRGGEWPGPLRTTPFLVTDHGYWASTHKPRF